jgi:hypothetical protein
MDGTPSFSPAAFGRRAKVWVCESNDFSYLCSVGEEWYSKIKDYLE